MTATIAISGAGRTDRKGLPARGVEYSLGVQIRRDVATLARHHGHWEEELIMFDSQIKRYENRIFEEEKLAREAISSESALAHQQVAMLYKTELAIFRSKRASTRGDTLAEIW